MEKEFVTYELAFRLKLLGFDEPCFGLFENKKLGFSFAVGDELITPIKYRCNSKFVKNILTEDCCTAPTWQSAFDWFGDKYQLYASVVVDQTSYPKYAYEISRFIGNPKDLTEDEWYWDDMIFSPSLYRTKTEARLYCLTELLNFVEEKELK